VRADPESVSPGDLTQLRGVGPALAEKLGKLGVHVQQDLLFVLPFRYEDRTRIMPIGGLLPGQRVVVEADVELTEVVYRRRRTMLCTIADGTGILTLRFFYFSRAQQNGLARGRRVRCYGEVRKGPNGLEMVHPEYRLLSEAEQGALEEHLTPIYPATEGVQQARIRNLIGQLLDNPAQQIDEVLPADIRSKHKLAPLAAAVRYLHRPPQDADAAQLITGTHPAQQRLALEEMLAHHLSLRQIRERANQDSAIALTARDNLVGSFIAGLGFTLTGDQQSALKTISQDLEASHPMMRLVQGDVGCGKTVVAAAAALQAISAGQQAALMAPTELLAEQHRDNFARWLKPLGIEMVWLSGSLKGQQRQLAYEAIASGAAQLIVGTHALFQEAVEYANLALVIVDEQHRFGVHQRLALMDKGRDSDLRPHQLVMTATPIPRTLAMTMYADLDVSIIRELPPGRQPVTTVALQDKRRGEIVSRVRDACAEGQRAYWVCPLIEESEALEYQDAESTHAMLCEALPDLSVGLVHGRMKSADKDRVMKAFAAGKHQVLVATTVIEVGVDVPEATLMIIENAERMGLAQLHQLRGRVGRGSDSSACVLLYKSPLSRLARERLTVMRETNDGFIVAQKDLELRGPGEVLGKRQTGLMQMRVADLMRDSALLPTVQQIAAELGGDYPDQIPPLIRRWIGTASEYGNV
jgi:ATP-dependent DNA helicase RecG